MKKLIPLIALALISGAAIAADKDKPMRETAATFDSLDQNHDQRISQSEAAGDVDPGVGSVAHRVQINCSAASSGLDRF